MHMCYRQGLTLAQSLTQGLTQGPLQECKGCRAGRGTACVMRVLACRGWRVCGRVYTSCLLSFSLRMHDGAAGSAVLVDAGPWGTALSCLAHNTFLMLGPRLCNPLNRPGGAPHWQLPYLGRGT